MDEEVESQLQQVVEKQEQGLPWAKEQYEEHLEDLLSRAGDAVSEDEVSEHAIAMVKSDVMEIDRVGGGGDVVDIVAIGHAGVQEWNDSDSGGKKEVVRSYGVIIPDDKPAGLAVFINDENTGVDLGGVMDSFEPLNTFKGVYRINESQNLNNTYICNSTSETRIEEQELEKVPDDEGEKRRLLQNFSDEAEILNIGDHLSMTNDSGYTIDFGADVKRIQGQITNRYVNEESGFGIYKILDSSVVDESDLEGTNVMGDEDRVPGLSVWCQPEQMKYGKDSQVEIYGQIRVNQGGQNEGQVVMDGYGIVPLIEMPIQDESSGEEAGGADVEKTTV